MQVENYNMDTNRKRKIFLWNILIYSCIGIITMVIHFPLFIYVTGYLIAGIENYFHPPTPTVFPNFEKILLNFNVSLLLLLIIELGVIWLFHKQLNRFFKIENLFTGKKIIWLAIIIIGVQMIISCWLWWC